MSERISDGLKDIEDRWTLDDVVSAHKVLDAMELADYRQSQRFRRKMSK